MKKKRRMRIHFLLLVLGFWLGHPAFAAPQRKFSVSFSGGMSYLASDEWFRGIRGGDLALVGEVLGSSFAIVRDGYGFERIGPEFSLEAAYRLTPRLSLGLGVGYLSRKWTLAGRFERRSFIPEDTANFDLSHAFKMTAFPISLYAAFEAVRTRTAVFGLTAAASFDVLRMDYNYDRHNTFFSRFDGAYKEYWETVAQDDAHIEAVGLRLGVFGERRLTEALATFVTAEFRLSPLGEVYGPYVRTSTFKSNDQLVYDVRETLPRRSVQPGTRFILTGPVLRGGLKVSF